MARKTNCQKGNIEYYRINRVVGKRLNSENKWVPKYKDFYGISKSDAEAQYQAYIDKQKLGVTIDEKRCFGEVADYYIYEVLISDSKLSNGTRERYEGCYKTHIQKSTLVEKNVSTLQTSDLQAFYNELDCTQATLRTIHNVMKHMFKYLAKEGHCRNVTENVSLPQKSKRNATSFDSLDSQEILVWTDQELFLIMSKLGEKEKRFRLILLLLIYTGCRIGEILALKYSDIKSGKLFINKKLESVAEINKNGKKVHRFEITPPKTTNSIRNIPLNEEILKEIENHKSWQREESVLNGYRTDYIFCTQSGKFIDRHNLNTAFERYYKRIGIEKKGIHTYRRTFCTNLCKSGVPLEIAYKLMGHKSISVTAQYYLHVNDDQKEHAINQMILGLKKITL